MNLLYPRRCPVCDEIIESGGGLICPPCLKRISFIKSPYCKKCGKEVISEAIEYCQDCTRHLRSFEYGIALVHYNEAAKHSMSGIKYKNKREYLDFYMEEASKRCLDRLFRMEADGMIPVPVHPSRRRQRGFNQAELIAERLGKDLGLPVYKDILCRNKKTEPQKGLTASNRLKNLEKAFAIKNKPEGIESILLVDDIYTTGSTIEACTRVLKQSGIKKVYFFVVCIGQGL